MNMENIVRTKIGKLTQAHFDEYPVWTWAETSWEEDEDLVCPVLQLDPLPYDEGDLFIKADIWTPTGLHFLGNVSLAVGDGVYAIEFALDGKDYGFNLHIFHHMKDVGEQSLAELREALDDINAQIFPLRYETKYRFEGKDLIAGIFDPISP